MKVRSFFFHGTYPVGLTCMRITVLVRQQPVVAVVVLAGRFAIASAAPFSELQVHLPNFRHYFICGNSCAGSLSIMNMRGCPC
jgi:hypothetical protein